jgi:Helix-hairpin-helix domain
VAVEPEVDDHAIAAARSKVGSAAQGTLDAVRHFAWRATALLGAPAALRESARQQVESLDTEAVAVRLRQKPLGSLKDVAGRGVRLNQLERAGFRTVADVLAAEDDRLHAVPGVGPQTVYQVVEAARLAAVQVHHDTHFRFDPDRPDPGQTRLLATLAAIRAADGTAATLREPLQNFTARTAPLAEEAERTTSRMKMFFAGRATKNGALAALARLDAILAEPSVQGLQQTVAQRQSAVDPSSYPPDHLWQGYRTDAASVNAVLATVGTRRQADEGEAARGFIPEELHQQITAVPLDTSLLTATLRGYQVFGAQYAIHQERSILGDEMGLGKTVQARRWRGRTGWGRSAPCRCTGCWPRAASTNGCWRSSRARSCCSTSSRARATPRTPTCARWTPPSTGWRCSTTSPSRSSGGSSWRRSTGWPNTADLLGSAAVSQS